MTLSRHPSKSTEQLAAIDSWFSAEHRRVMTSETLTPAAKRERLEALRKEYRERWYLAKQAAEADISEWSEIYEGRAAQAQEPKLPEDKDARILKSLELQRLHGRIERHKDQPGRLLALYERAIRSGDNVIAHELEDALPALLPEEARADFEKRAREERYNRLSESDKEKIAEAEAWKRASQETEHALALLEHNRAAGFVPGEPTGTRLVTRHQPGGVPPETFEVPGPKPGTPDDGPGPRFVA